MSLIKGNYSCEEDDPNNRGLTDIYGGPNAEKSKLRLKTVENNLCKLKIKKIICGSYKCVFDLTFFTVCIICLSKC